MKIKAGIGCNARLFSDITKFSAGTIYPSNRDPFAPVFAEEDAVVITGSGRAGEEHSFVLLFADPQPWPPPARTIVWENDENAIPSATGARFTPLDTFPLTVLVTASNGSGTTLATRSAVVNLLPGYASLPTMSGEFFVGGQVTVSPPTTIGQVISLTYSWRRDDEEVATGNAYTWQPEDEGHLMTVVALLQGTAGTTTVISNPVIIGVVAPTVTITGVTTTGYTDTTTYSVEYDTTGVIDFIDIKWYESGEPGTIVRTGNDVTFTDPSTTMRVEVFVGNSSGSDFDVSDENIVILQRAAPTVTSATIDKGGTSVAPGTILNALINATGSPAVFTHTIQWKDNGINQSTGPTYVVGADDVGLITYSYVTSNGVAPDATGNSSNSVSVTAGTTPDLTGVPDLDLTINTGIHTLDLTDSASNHSGGTWSIVLNAVGTTYDHAFTTGEYSFFDYKWLFMGATQWTATGTAQVTTPFTGSPAALPTGFANSEQSGVVRIADTVADGAYSFKIWAGDGSTAVSITVTATGSEAGSITVPPAPPDANWTLTDAEDGRLAITVISPFPNGGSPNTDREYEVDDSGDWVSFGITGNGTFYIPSTELTLNQEASVKLRSTNAEGVGDESTAKTAIPTSPTVLQATTSDDFVTWSQGSGLTSATESDDFITWSN